MKVFLKRSAVGSTEEIDKLLKELRAQQDEVEACSHQLVGAQRQLDSRLSKISELSGRLKHRNYIAQEEPRLRDDLERMKDTTSLENTVMERRKAYDSAREKLRTMQNSFDETYVSIEAK